MISFIDSHLQTIGFLPDIFETQRILERISELLENYGYFLFLYDCVTSVSNTKQFELNLESHKADYFLRTRLF